MRYEFIPRGVCSRKMVFEVEDGIVRSLMVDGGCNGNLKGISELVKGLPIDEVIKRLEGIKCGPRPTSCPDQMAQALKKFKSEYPQ